MHYTDEDYARLYGQQDPKPRALSLREFLLLALAAVALGFLLGCDDSNAAEIAAKLEAEAHLRKGDARPEDVLPLSKPLHCDATMIVSAGGIFYRETCYAAKERVWL